VEKRKNKQLSEHCALLFIWKRLYLSLGWGGLHRWAPGCRGGVWNKRLLLMGLQYAISIMNINSPRCNAQFEKSTPGAALCIRQPNDSIFSVFRGSHDCPWASGVNIMAFMDIALNCGIYECGNLHNREKRPWNEKFGKMSFTYILELWEIFRKLRLMAWTLITNTVYCVINVAHMNKEWMDEKKRLFEYRLAIGRLKTEKN
jgi:hypothetical protein